MSYPRREFQGAGPWFSVELPPGLVFAPLAELERVPAFSLARPFAAVVAVNGPAAIVFSLAPAEGMASVTAAVERFAGERGSENPGLFFDKFGGETRRHPGMLAEIAAGCLLAVVEDGGRALVMEAFGERDIWPDYGPFLEAAMRSLELAAPAGPTLPITAGEAVPVIEPGERGADAIWADERRAALDAKAGRASALVADNRFDEAEAVLTGGDASAEAYARMAAVYESQLAAGGWDRATREVLHHRALEWWLRSYPEAHTAEEAERYSLGMAADRARLAALVG